MGGEKSPVPDGLNSFFYKNFWHILGVDVQAMVLGVLNDGNDFPDFNHTNICLVSKNKIHKRLLIIVL